MDSGILFAAVGGKPITYELGEPVLSCQNGNDSGFYTYPEEVVDRERTVPYLELGPGPEPQAIWLDLLPVPIN